MTQKAGSPAPETGRFRILKQGKNKLSVRLEEPYWHQLEACAEDAGSRLSSYVFQVLDELPDRANKTAFLRLHCLTWLQSRLRAVTTKRVINDMAPVLSACPAPSLLLSRTGKVLMYNKACRETIFASVPDENAQEISGLVTRTLGAALRQSMSILERRPDQIVTGRTHVPGVDGRVQKSVNVTLIDKASPGTSPILVYVYD